MNIKPDETLETKRNNPSTVTGDGLGSPALRIVSGIISKLERFLVEGDKSKMEDADMIISELEVSLRNMRESFCYNYDTYDYESRLCMSTQDIDRLISEKVLVGALGETYERLISLLPDNGSAKAATDIFKKRFFADAAYEGAEEDKDYIRIVRHMPNRNVTPNAEWYEKEIRGLNDNGSEYLYLGHYEIGKTLSQKIFTSIVSGIENFGYKEVNLNSSGIGNHYKGREIIELTELLGSKGVRKIDYSHCQLQNALSSEELIELVSRAGKSGIRSLNLSGGRLNHYGADTCRRLVRAAGNSSIKSLHIGGSFFGKGFEPSEILDIVSEAGKSGIRSFDICFSELFQSLGRNGVMDLAEVAGKSGIRYFGIQGNRFLELLGYDDYISFISLLGDSGIKGLTDHSAQHGKSLADEDILMRIFDAAGSHGIRFLMFPLDMSIWSKIQWKCKEQIIEKYNMKLNV